MSGFDQFIALILIVSVWCGLLAGFVAWERLKRNRKRDRFQNQLRRWQS